MKIALIYADRLDSTALYALQNERLLPIKNLILQQGHQLECYSRLELPDSFENTDLVIAAGGDGTLLDAAIRMLDVPLCAIRLFPEKSVGFHCAADYQQFEELFNAILTGTARTMSVPRLQAWIDNVPIHVPVLNDILLAHPCPARASRYEIAFRDTTEMHCSSGIWFSTQPGSHGASKSAGAPVLESADYNRAVFCVRECSNLNAQIKSDIFTPARDKLSIKVLSQELMLFIDGGISIFPIKRNQTLSLGVHPNPLKKWIL